MPVMCKESKAISIAWFKHRSFCQASAKPLCTRIFSKTFRRHFFQYKLAHRFQLSSFALRFQIVLPLLIKANHSSESWILDHLDGVSRLCMPLISSIFSLFIFPSSLPSCLQAKLFIIIFVRRNKREKQLRATPQKMWAHIAKMTGILHKASTVLISVWRYKQYQHWSKWVSVSSNRFAVLRNTTASATHCARRRQHPGRPASSCPEICV